MIFPYPHKAALAQIPVSYPIKDETFLLYPLRLRDILDMDMWLHARLVKEYSSQAELLPDDERAAFVRGLSSRIDGLDSTKGLGYKLLWGNSDALVHLVSLLTRRRVTAEHIREVIFPNGLTNQAVDVVAEMKRAVWRDPPPVPKLKVVEKKPRYTPTSDEQEAFIYHFLATKYHWTYDQILDLTDYQAFWFCYMFPDEREHYEDMDALIHNSREAVRRSQEESPPQPPGTIHFNSPEEYERWKQRRAERENK